MRDIGFHFPDTDDAYKGIDSKLLLKKVDNIMKEKGYCIVNIDSVIMAQKPKLQKVPHRMQAPFRSAASSRRGPGRPPMGLGWEGKETRLT